MSQELAFQITFAPEAAEIFRDLLKALNGHWIEIDGTVGQGVFNADETILYNEEAGVNTLFVAEDISRIHVPNPNAETHGVWREDDQTAGDKPT